MFIMIVSDFKLSKLEQKSVDNWVEQLGFGPDDIQYWHHLHDSSFPTPSDDVYAHSAMKGIIKLMDPDLIITTSTRTQQFCSSGGKTCVMSTSLEDRRCAGRHSLGYMLHLCAPTLTKYNDNVSRVVKTLLRRSGKTLQQAHKSRF
jgi:hypothetical protein